MILEWGVELFLVAYEDAQEDGSGSVGRYREFIEEIREFR